MYSIKQNVKTYKYKGTTYMFGLYLKTSLQDHITTSVPILGLVWKTPVTNQKQQTLKNKKNNDRKQYTKRRKLG